MDLHTSLIAFNFVLSILLRGVIPFLPFHHGTRKLYRCRDTGIKLAIFCACTKQELKFYFLCRHRVRCTSLCKFEKSVAEGTNVETVEGSLEIDVRSIPGIEISGSGSLNLEEQVERRTENLRVRFVSDFPVPQVPTSFAGAVRTFRNITNIINNRVNFEMVPKRVHLLPLSSIDPNGVFDTLQSITDEYVNSMVQVIQETEDMIAKVQTLKESRASGSFDYFERDIGTFIDQLVLYRQRMQTRFGEVLPDIRGGLSGVTALDAILDNHRSSEFALTNLENWVDSKVSEGVLP